MIDWANLLKGFDTDDAALRFIGFVLNFIRRFIATKPARYKFYKHPWNNKCCNELFDRNQLTAGISAFAVARVAFIAGFATVYGILTRVKYMKLLTYDAKNS